MTDPRAFLLFFVTVFSVTAFSGVASARDKRECISASTEGQVARDEGNLREARKQFRICAVDECPAVVRKSCVTWLGEVEALLPSVVLRVQDSEGEDLIGVRVVIDGEAHVVDGKPLELNPGPHVVQAEVEGEVLEHKVLLASGEKSRLVLLRASSKAETSAASTGTGPEDESSGFSVPTSAWVLGGVAVAGAASFTVFGLMARSQYEELEGDCAPGCSDNKTQLARTNALVADISLGVGVAAAVGAVLVTVFSGNSEEQATAGGLRFDVAPMERGAVTLLTLSN